MNISVTPARRVGDPGAPQLRADVGVALLLAAAVAALVVATAGGRSGDLAVLGAIFVAGELLAVELTDGTALPLSLALLLPLVVAAGPGWIAAVAGGAVLLAATTRRPRSALAAAADAQSRVVAGLAAWGAHRAVAAVTDDGRPLATLLALTAAAVAVLAVELAARWLRRAESFTAAGGWAAFFAVGASGLLMAVAYDGLDGERAMGLWGVPVFAVPALSARWAFGRLHAIRRTYDQTIDVLSVVPEMGARVRPGHSRRVADLSLAMSRMLGLARPVSTDLERAALLHALGSVTLEEPEQPGPRDLAVATARVLHGETSLSGPAALVAHLAGDRAELTGDDRLAAEVLTVAASYEHLTGGDPTRARMALDVLGSPPLAGDRRVVAALTRVVVHRRRGAA